MADEHALLAEGPDAIKRLREQVARLPALRRDGLRLVSAGNVEVVAAWHRQWTVLLDVIGPQLEREAPRQAGLVLWPAVSETQDLKQMRTEVVQAAIGCRELELLVSELGETPADSAEPREALPAPQEAGPGSTYVGAGQQFEGAMRLRQLIEPARESLVVIDQYMDDSTFTLAAAAPNGISRRFLTSNHRGVRSGVTEAWAEWRVNWEGESECLTSTGSELPHFRLLYVDRAVYLIDSSLKDFGSRLTFFRMLPTDERESIEREIESTWRRATPL